MWSTIPKLTKDGRTSMTAVNVRYGPSPTGIPHIGNIRTALFNFLFAKSQRGKFFLRIEDTDQNRIVPGAVEKIKKSLEILGLNWDSDVIFQSKRLDLYKSYLQTLEGKGYVYKDDRAWRFKIKTEKKSIAWQDTVHGEISFGASVIEDFIIVKSDGYPTYHFASVIDDHEMQISHVMRGDEWVSSTPKHILLYDALGWQHPQFAHLPPILGHDHKKLSKRDGAKSVLEYTQEGYLPEAIVNFMVLLGWAPKDNREIFSLEELIREFSLDRINKNSPIFNVEKLNWFNGQWIRKSSDTDLAKYIHQLNPDYKIDEVEELLPLVKDRLQTLTDFEKLAGPILAGKISVDPSKITLDAEKLTLIKNAYQDITNWTKENISTTTMALLESEKLTKPQALGTIGMAISGSTITPPIFDTLEKLGKSRTIERLQDVIKKKQK